MCITEKNKSSGFNSNAESVAASDSLNISTNTNQDGLGGALQMTLLETWLDIKINSQLEQVQILAARISQVTQWSLVLLVMKQLLMIQRQRRLHFVRLNARNDYYGLYATDTFSYTDKLHLTLSGRYNVAKVNLSGTTHDDNALPVDF